MRKSILIGLVGGLASAVAFYVYCMPTVDLGSDPQAPIAFIMMPVVLASVGLVGMAGFWAISEVVIFLYKATKGPLCREDRLREYWAIALLLTVLGVVGGVYWIGRYEARELGVARNATDPDVLRGVHASADHRRLMALADNPACPPDVLRKMGRNQYISVRYRVASNPNSPIDLLVTLSEDADWVPRKAVALNPKTPEEVVRRLANDPEPHVRVNAEYALSRRTASHPAGP